MFETDLQRDFSPARPFRPGTEVRYLRDEMRRIGRLTNAGSQTEAREACAALMFDLQVIIVGRPHLAWQFAELLGQCGATGLSRRFQIAAGLHRVSVLRRAHSPRPPQSVTVDTSPAPALIGELTTD